MTSDKILLNDQIVSNYLHYLRKCCLVHMKNTTLILISYESSYYIFYDDSYNYPRIIIQNSTLFNDNIIHKFVHTYDNNQYNGYIVQLAHLNTFKNIYKHYDITILSSSGDVQFYYPSASHIYNKPEYDMMQTYCHMQESKLAKNQTMLSKITCYGSFEDIVRSNDSLFDSSYSDIDSVMSDAEDVIRIKSNYCSPVLSNTPYVFVTVLKD